MSKLEKLIASLLGDSSDHAFSDLKKVLLKFGFVEDRSKGSHPIFRHEDGRRQVIPKKHGRRVRKSMLMKPLNFSS
ncbi:MAG: type II toxin-antitoxin system HicA family toxin [Pseudomonadota bacterium]